MPKANNNGETHLKIGGEDVLCYDCGKPFITGYIRKDKSFEKNDNKNDEPVESYVQDENGEWCIKLRHFGCEGISPPQRARLLERYKDKIKQSKVRMIVSTQHLSWWEREALNECVDGA